MDTPANLPPSQDRALVPLLTAITILFAVLVVGLGIGAIAAMRAVHEARAEVARLTGAGGRKDERRRGDKQAPAQR